VPFFVIFITFSDKSYNYTNDCYNSSAKTKPTFYGNEKTQVLFSIQN